jgi:hypothetical protein
MKCRKLLQSRSQLSGTVQNSRDLAFFPYNMYIITGMYCTMQASTTSVYPQCQNCTGILHCAAVSQYCTCISFSLQYPGPVYFIPFMHCTLLVYFCHSTPCTVLPIAFLEYSFPTLPHVPYSALLSLSIGFPHYHMYRLFVQFSHCTSCFPLVSFPTVPHVCIVFCIAFLLSAVIFLPDVLYIELYSFLLMSPSSRCTRTMTFMYWLSSCSGLFTFDWGQFQLVCVANIRQSKGQMIIMLSGHETKKSGGGPGHSTADIMAQQIMYL